jgi:hypothetical protein
MERLGSKLVKRGDGVAFYCPACDELHWIRVYHVRPDYNWGWNQDASMITFTPSVKVSKDWLNSICHSFVTNNTIIYCADCTHDKAGITVDLPDIPETCFPAA